MLHFNLGLNLNRGGKDKILHVYSKITQMTKMHEVHFVNFYLDMLETLEIVVNSVF